ncbi:MAG: putative protein tyrosine phosphatase [Saprospiraceae bacterium]|jgi:predicted protein tyrosine phosphatase
MNLLFVCSRNIWRSRTAETIFRNREGIQVKSAGTSNSAKIKISYKLIEWADLIFVMENKHKKRMSALFTALVSSKEIIVLNITDDFKYMDEELVKNLEDSVSFYINN